MPFRLGDLFRSESDPEPDDDATVVPFEAPRLFEPQYEATSLGDIEHLLVRVFAMVGEAIAGATDALLTSDRQSAKTIMAGDEIIDGLSNEIASKTQRALVLGATTSIERRELVAVLRMLPDLERNGDLAEHIARRAARGLGSEITSRSRGLIERMGEVATEIWRLTADNFAERLPEGARHVDDLDDELDDLHVSLTAEVVSGSMPVPVAIELAMVARFYERFGDHAVNLARRTESMVRALSQLQAEAATATSDQKAPDQKAQ